MSSNSPFRGDLVAFGGLFTRRGRSRWSLVLGGVEAYAGRPGP
jgi:hypothetical protein